MGDALSLPEDSELDEGQLLAQLIQLLSQRPGQSVALSDLSALVPSRVRQAASGRGGLHDWLQSWPAIIQVSGGAGREVVTLTLGGERGDGALQLHHPQPSGPGAPRSAAAADEEGKEPRPGGGGVPNSEATRAPSEPATLSSGTTPVSPAGGAEAPKREEAAPFDEEIDGLRCVLLRGLPFKATVGDIRAFLGDFAAELDGEDAVHLALNRDGRPSGFARVRLVSAEAAERCRDGVHLRCMEDRYVEVFPYLDRPHKGRQAARLRGEDAALGPGDGRGGALAAAAAGGTKEQVVREVRVAMAEPKNRCQLLSMLGVALSARARAYLKQADQGLKHFLAQFPSEFSVDGAKGSEYVTYTPAQISDADGTAPSCTPIQLSEALAPPEQPLHLPLGAMEGYAVAVGEGASVGSSARGDKDMPSARSPRQEKADPAAPASAASAGCQFATPSPWPSPAPAWGAPPWQPLGAAPPPPWPAAAAGWGVPAPWHLPAGPPLLGWDGFGPPGMPDAAAAAALAAAQETSQGPAVPPPAGGGQAPLRLRGLPFTSSEQDVLAFFAQHDIVELIADGPRAVALLLRANGRPTGQAVVQMRCRADADIAQQVLHGKWMGNRYIEVFPHVEDGSVPGAGGCGGAHGGKDDPAAGCPDAEVGSAGTSAATTAGDGTGSAASQADLSNAGTPFPYSPALPPWAAVGWPGSAPSLPGAAADASWDALFEFLGQDKGAAAQAAAMAGLANAA